MEIQKNLPLVGSLSDHFFIEIFAKLHQASATGVLEIQKDRQKKSIFVKAGCPVYIDATPNKQSFGDFLVKRKMITLDQWDELDKSHSDFDQCEMVVSKRYLSPSEAMEQLSHRHRQLLVDCFSWFDGRYSFLPNDIWPEKILHLPIHTEQVMEEGINRFYVSSKIYNYFNINSSTKLVIVSPPDRQSQISTFVTRTLKQFLVPRTISQVSQKISLDEVVVAKHVLLFLVSGWMTPEGREEERLEVSPQKVLQKSVQVTEKLDLSFLREEENNELDKNMMHFLNKDFFQILNVVHPLDRKQLERAFVNKMALYQRYASDENMVAITATLGTVYETLKSPFLRSIYVRRGKRQIQQATVFDDEITLFKALSMMCKMEFDPASRILEGLATKYPHDGMILGYFSWCHYQAHRERGLSWAITQLKQAIDMHERDSGLHYYLALLYFEGELYEKSIDELDQAISIRPQFPEAKKMIKDVRLQLAKKAKKTK
ncbi:MAG: DUF4388 domain-containing protein [Bdellovibrionota bacterium]